MKKVVLACSILLSGCGAFSTGEGIFNGRIVDVEWGGLVFKSCEVTFQLGEQSSSTSRGSSRDKNYCDFLTSQIGQIVSIKYKTWVNPCCVRTDSRYELLK